MQEEVMPIQWVDCSIGVRSEKEGNHADNIATQKEPLKEIMEIGGGVLLIEVEDK